MLVDIDTGFGGVLNVARTAREMWEANVAAVQLEDQQLPKKCGHLNGKKLVSTEEMVQKIRAIKKAAPSLVIVARTDARAVESLESAIDKSKSLCGSRGRCYFPGSSYNQKRNFVNSAQSISVPMLANMTEFGKTPYYTAEEFADMGYQMVIYPVTSLRVAAKAYERIFQLIKEQGTQKEGLDDMQTRSELYSTISYYEFEGLDQEIAKTLLTKGQ